MSIISEPERSELYKKVKHVLGAPLRSIELEEEQMDTLLEFSIDEYSQYVQDWLTESQWTNLYNLNLDTQSLSKAFTTRSLDYETRYTYAYSKIVGLQAGGDSVLKKDFIQLVKGQQIYEIPANRELNELLWFTPATLNSSMFGAGFGFGEFGGGIGGAGGFAQMGNMAGSYFMMPAFDMLLRRWFIAYCKETLARVRGKFSGNLKTPDGDLTMDYAALATEAKDEKTKLIDELIGAEGRLTRLKPEKVMEREALIAENLNKALKFRAMPRQIYVI